MKTLLTKSPRRAAEFINKGEIVAFPTETVYGLAANVFDSKALRKIFRAKRRPADNPFIAHVASKEQISLLAERITPSADKFIQRFFPGPLTVVLPKRPTVSLVATAGLSTIGIRMPRHSVAKAFLRACGVPLAAPSANLSGTPSPTTWRNVRADLDGRISCILIGGQAKVGLESTVVDCTGTVPKVLRVGAVTLEQLRAVVPSTRLLTHKSRGTPKSPGMKYRHYAPHARVSIVSGVKNFHGLDNAAYIGIDKPPQSGRFVLCLICKNTDDYAHHLYEFFRRCDARRISVIYCERVAKAGLGLALMDRLKKAAKRN